MKVNFNNLRRQLCFSHDRLIHELNTSQEHEGYLLVDPNSIAEELNHLRQLIGSVAMTFNENDPEFEDVYQKEYTDKDKHLAEFKFEEEV